MPDEFEQYRVKTEDRPAQDDWEKYRVAGEPSKPSYWEAAKTGFREGISGALKFYEAPFKPIARAMGIPPGLEASEWIKPSEEEARRAEEMDIPHQVARGFGGLPGAALKYGPTGRVLGPVAAFMAPEVIEGISEGRPLPEMARRTAMAGGVGLGFKYLPKSMLARVPALAGLFGGQTTAEALIEGRPLGEALKAGIAPSVVGGAIGLLPGGRREIPRREPPPEAKPITEPTRLLPYKHPELEWWRGAGAKGVEGISSPYPERLALPPGQGFTMEEPPSKPIRRPPYTAGEGVTDITPEGEVIYPGMEPMPRPEAPPPTPTRASEQPWKMTDEELIKVARGGRVWSAGNTPELDRRVEKATKGITGPEVHQVAGRIYGKSEADIAAFYLWERRLPKVGETLNKLSKDLDQDKLPKGLTIEFSDASPSAWIYDQDQKVVAEYIAPEYIAGELEGTEPSENPIRSLASDLLVKNPKIARQYGLNQIDIDLWQSRPLREIAKPSPTRKGETLPPGMKVGLKMPAEAIKGKAPTLEGTPLMEAAKKAEVEKVQPTLVDLFKSGKKGITQEELSALPDVKTGAKTPEEMTTYLEDKGIKVEAERTPEQVVDQLIADKKALPFEREKLIRQITEPRVEPPPAEAEFAPFKQAKVAKKPPEVSGFDRETWDKGWDWLRKEGWKKEETDKGVDVIAPDGERITKFASQIDPGEPASISVWILNKGLRNEWLERTKPKFATGERPIAPLSPEDLQRVSDAHSLENSPEKRIVSNPGEIPERILNQIPEDQRANIQGVYDPAERVTYLVRDNIGSEGELKDIIDHEDVKHYAVDEWLGKDAESWYNRVYLKYGRKSFEDIATKRGFNLDTREGRMEAAREKIARTPIDEPGVIKQFWAWLREKLSKIFPDMKISDEEIQRTFKQAREAMERGEFRERDERIDSLRKQVRNIQAVYTERAQFATSPKEVGKKFAEEDLVPKAARFGKGLKESYEWIADGLVPVRGVPAKAMQTVKHYMGKLMEGKETLTVKEIIGDLTGRKIGNTFDKMSEKQNEDFINLGMVGEKQASPLLDQIREFMGNIDQHNWEEAKSYKPDLGWVDNHLRLLLKPGSSSAQVKLFRDTLSRKFPGTMGWSKQRFYETLQAAQEAGLELAVKNPWEMWKLGHLDVQQFIQFNKMKSALQNEGFLKQFKPEGPGKAFKGLEGYAKTTENMNNIWFPGKGEGWYIEENLGRILNNYLSPDRIRANALGRTMMSIKNHTTVMELAVNAFHATTETTTAVFSALGEAGRKIYNVGILQGNQRAIEQGLKDLAKAPFAPLDARLGGSLMKYFANPEEFKKTFRGSEFLKKIPNPDEWLQLLWDSGARFGMSEDYRLNSLKTFKQNLASKNYIGAIFRSVPSLNEIMMRPLFENYIPKLKVGTWLKETANMIAEKSEDIISGKITKEQIGAERWNSVEERFGEMSFDNQFWNRTFKTGMQMFIRSLTWQTGNIKQFGKGITGQSRELISAMREGRMPKLTPEGAWMIATFAGTAAIGYITQKALSGKDVESWKDFFYPQIDEDGNRISIPGYAKVGFAMAHHPLRYAGGALAGWFGRFTDVINNKEFYGAQIHDPEQNVISQRIDDLIHLVPLPFSYTSFKKAREEGEPFLKQFTGVLGATQAPYWIRTSEAQQLATELAGAKIPAGGMTKADRARTDLIKKYAREYQQAQRKGESVDEIFSKVQGDLQSGKLIQRDLLRFKQRITHEPLEQSVLRLSLKEALRVWEKATPGEQMKIAPYVLKKFRTTQSPEEREMAMPKIQEIAGGMR